MPRRVIPLAFGLLFALSGATAEDTEKTAKPIPEPTRFITQHSGRFNGETIRYTVTAGETYIRDEAGEPKASIFSFAYTKKVDEDEVRPVTFVWMQKSNGNCQTCNPMATGCRNIDGLSFPVSVAIR